MAFTVCQTFGRAFAEEPEAMRGTRVYNVSSDTAITDLNDVLDAADIPDISDAWDSALTALVVVSRTPEEVGKEMKFFKVVVEYETDDTLSGWKATITTVRASWAPQMTRSPWANAPTYPFDAGRYISPDGNTGATSMSGYPPINRAGDPFASPVKIDRYFQKITLVKTVEDISDIGDSTITDVDDIVSFIGKMSSATTKIAGITGVQWTFLMDDITLERIPRADGTYNTKVTFQILYDKEQTHASPVLNAGFREMYTKKDGITLAVRDVKNLNGATSKKPSLLDVDGSVIQTRDLPPGGASPDGPPYYIVFPFRAEVDFDLLELPEEWAT